MTKFKKFNLIFGWTIFAIAAITYIATMEPTASLWDCGEFTATSYKLEVGHPPGAPLFMMIGKVFSLLALGNVAKVAMMMNLMSALSSAFTILFLFWSISYIAKKIILANTTTTTAELTNNQLIIVIGSAVVGALAYTFSDSFWFSAVEAEVYALSSLFTAVVFWAILKWDEHADEKHADRWIILIAYLMGLSIGVHLLNLLAIPAIALVYYFRRYKPSTWGGILVFGISLIILLIVMYGVIQGLVSIGSRFDLLFVNKLGLPFNSGFVFFIILLLASIIALLIWSKKKNKPALHTSTLALLVVLIGYSSFAMVVVRSVANPPIDENNPENTFALKSYLNREQYGDRPLLYGQYYDAEITGKEDLYTYIEANGKYAKVKKTNPKYIYDTKSATFFPRMFSTDENHISAYKNWGGVKPGAKPKFSNNIKFFFSYQLGYMYLRYFSWNFIGRQNDIQGHGGPLKGNWLSGIPFIDKITAPQDDIPDKWKNRASRNKYYFLPFILGLLGLFYQSSKEKQTFWVVMTLFIMTGIAIAVYLNQTPYQPRERDYAYVGSFYAFAIWIGLSVLAIAEFTKKIIKNEKFRTIAALILPILVPILMGMQNWDDHDRSGRYHTIDIASNYLNTCAKNAILFTFGDNDTFPLWYAQEVEGVRTDVRDVNLSLFSTDWYADQMSRKAYESEPVPIKLDHSKYQTGTRDIIFVKQNPNVLFKEKYQGNKKEFEPRYKKIYDKMLDIIEISNFSKQYAADYQVLSKGHNSVDIETFFGFIGKLSRNAEDININKAEIDTLVNKATKLAEDISNAYTPIDAVMDFVISDDKSTKLGYGGEFKDYIPTKKLLIPVDKQKIIEMGFVAPDKYDKIGDNIKFTLSRDYMVKSQWLILRILAENNWKRPIYFAASIGMENYLGLQNYFRQEGFAYRLMPYPVQKTNEGLLGEINTDILYDNLMNFAWGGIKNDHFNVDHYIERTLNVMDVRSVYNSLATALINENKKEKAKKVLDFIVEELPDNKFAYDYNMLQIIENYYKLGDTEKANTIAKQLIENYSQQITYFGHFKANKMTEIDREYRIALFVLQQLYIILGQHEQKDIAEQIEPILQANINRLQN